MKLPTGYTFDWGGEYKDYLAARDQMKVIAPLTLLLILLILFALYGNMKFPLIILFSVHWPRKRNRWAAPARAVVYGDQF